MHMRCSELSFLPQVRHFTKHFTHVILISITLQPYETVVIIIPILQIRQLGLTDARVTQQVVRELGFNQNCLISKLMPLTSSLHCPSKASSWKKVPNGFLILFPGLPMGNPVVQEWLQLARVMQGEVGAVRCQWPWGELDPVIARVLSSINAVDTVAKLTCKEFFSWEVVVWQSQDVIWRISRAENRQGKNKLSH